MLDIDKGSLNFIKKIIKDKDYSKIIKTSPIKLIDMKIPNRKGLPPYYKN